MESDCLNCDIGFYCTTHCIQVWCMLQQFCLLAHQSLSEMNGRTYRQPVSPFNSFIIVLFAHQTPQQSCEKVIFTGDVKYRSVYGKFVGQLTSTIGKSSGSK